MTVSEVEVDENDSNPSETCPSRSVVSHDQSMARKHRASTIDCERSSRGPAVDPVTFKGNSDPFNSLAIPIGASVSQLLEFARDYAVTALYGTQVDWRQPLAQQVRPKLDGPP